MIKSALVPLNASAIKARARELGFDLCGIARAERYQKLSRLSEWIAEGRAGELNYLSDSADERIDPFRVLPTVRSVICLGTIYNTRQPYSNDVADPSRMAIARYAWGDDYHEVVRARLRALVVWMAEMAPGLEAFSCVDDGPVQERVFAEQAGLGWIGKNTCVINHELGSWFFLGEVLCNLDLDADEPAIDRCGTCTRCIDACPTGAIVQPYTVDATRCISYLTIETRGELSEADRPVVAQHLFGCDICQDVCPWNRAAATSEDVAWQAREGLASPKLIDLARRSDPEWRALIDLSALRRAGLRRLRRTLAYALGASNDADADAALGVMAAEPSAADPLVADAIRWARARRVNR